MWLWKQDLNWPMTSAILVRCSTNWANKPPTSQIWSRLKITFILMSLSTVQIYGFQTCVFWCEIIVHQYSTSIGFTVYWNRHPTVTDALPLPTEDIMDLFNLCLTTTYFQYNGKHYKQLHGTAMGSQKLWCKISRNAPLQLADNPYRFGYATLTTHLPPYTKTKLTLFHRPKYVGGNGALKVTCLWLHT